MEQDSNLEVSPGRGTVGRKAHLRPALSGEGHEVDSG